jgi:hypothetical protein
MAFLRRSDAIKRIGSVSSEPQTTALAGIGIAEAKYGKDPASLVGDFDLEYLVMVILKMYERPALRDALTGRFKDNWDDELSEGPPNVCPLPEQSSVSGVYLRHHEGFYFSQTYPDEQLQPLMSFGARAAFELMISKLYPVNGQIDFLFLLTVILETFKTRLKPKAENNLAI